MATAQGIRAGRAYVEIGASLTKLQSGLEKAKSKCEDFADKAASKLKFGASIAGPAAVAVKTFASFDDQMRLVQGVTGATGKQFDELAAKAKELGATTSWTAEQVAEGMVSLGRAGFKSNEINASIKSVMDLARATGTEIEPATDIAGNALRSFGLQASEMSRVCDVLAATANGSAQTLDDLGEAFKYVAPLAASTGLTIEDTAKIVGALANFGVKGSQAGTVFKNIQARMATDKNAISKYAELGINTTDENGNLRKINDVLIELGERIKNMPSAEKLETIKTLFGQYGLTGVSLTAANFKELNDAIDQAGGTAARVAETMDAGIGGAMRITKSAIEGFAISVGESLVPHLTKLAEKIQAVSGWLTEFNNKNPGVIGNIVKMATNVVALQSVFWMGGKTASFFVGQIQALMSVVSNGAKVCQFAMGGFKKAADLLTGANKASQASLRALAAYQSSLFGLEQASIAATTAKTASEKAAAAVNYAAAESEVALARATLNSANAKAASAAASAKALAATFGFGAVVAVVAALAYVYLKWASSAERAAEAARKATDAQERFSQERAQQRETDRQLFEELKNLEQQQTLSNDQMARAQYILKELTDRYGDLGIKVDEFSRKVIGATDAQKAFNEAQKKQEIQDIKNEIATMEEEKARLHQAIENNQSWWRGFGNAVSSGFSSSRMLEKHQEKVDRLAELERKLRSARNKLDLAENSNETVAQIEQNAQEQQFRQPTQDVIPSKTELPKEAEDFFDAAKETAEKSLNAETAVNLDSADINVEIPEINVPGIDEETFQGLADAAVENANETDSKGTFSAFDEISIDNGELAKQTSLMTRQLDYLRDTRDFLAQNDPDMI